MENFKFDQLLHAIRLSETWMSPHAFVPALVEVREDLVLELAQRSHGSGSKSKGFENEADVLSSLATCRNY